MSGKPTKRKRTMRQDPRYTTVQAIHDLRESYTKMTARPRAVEQMLRYDSYVIVRLKGGKWWTDRLNPRDVLAGDLARLGYFDRYHYGLTVRLLQGLIQLGIVSKADAKQFTEEAQAYRLRADRRLTANAIIDGAKILGVKLPIPTVAQIKKAVGSRPAGK